MIIFGGDHLRYSRKNLFFCLSVWFLPAGVVVSAEPWG